MNRTDINFSHTSWNTAQMKKEHTTSVIVRGSSSEFAISVAICMDGPKQLLAIVLCIVFG